MRFVRYIVLFLTAVLLTCCTSESRETPVVPEEKDGGIVTLKLRVGISSTPGMDGGRDNARQTRAGEYSDGYPYEFEDAATVYEGINTLRVIIVDPASEVEHNELWRFSDKIPAAGDLYGDMEFKVKGGEKKRIYLIANEAGITPAIDFTQYVAGYQLTAATAASWNIYAGGILSEIPYIDNEGETKRYVPMSEFFDVDVVKESIPATTQSEVLFITRSVVKFSFFVNASEEIPESFRITSLEFNNVMQKGYLLPKNTEYLPGKYPLTSDFQRIVKSFSTPGFDDNRLHKAIFKPANFGLNAKLSSTTYKNSYAPQLYFMETRNNNDGNKFFLNCTVTWDYMDKGEKEPEESVFDYVELPNLPNFPRNTHVKVYITFSDRKFKALVDVVPYIGVDLKPEFGFGDIIKGEHIPNDDPGVKPVDPDVVVGK